MTAYAPAGPMDATEAPIEVFSTCPAPIGDLRWYLERVAEVARWSERHGCRGMLIYSDNRLIDPWLVSHLVVSTTRALSPLVVVSPRYQHPHTTAKLVASFSGFYARRLYMNWVAGGGRNHLVLDDDRDCDIRYERLFEHAEIVRALTDGGTVTYKGVHYRVRDLTLRPEVDRTSPPEFMVSGSSPAARKVSRRLGAVSVTRAFPPANGQTPTCAPGLTRGLYVGVIARPDAADAWRLAYQRFPPDCEGALMRKFALKVPDSHADRQLSRLVHERAERGDACWMGPCEHYKTMCPYLVGTHEEVAGVLATYIRRGSHTFIMDEPAAEADLEHARIAFNLATKKEGVAT